jgi:hypothetical protein
MPDTDEEEDKCPICLSEINNPAQPENCKVSQFFSEKIKLINRKASFLLGTSAKMGDRKDHVPSLQC